MSEHTDEWITEELVCELRDALKLKRQPMIFVCGREERDRVKRLLPIARKMFKKYGGAEEEKAVPSLESTMELLVSEEVLKNDWSKPEEDGAWADL